jgi:outer membrane biosynthesis protein TonB
VTCHDACERLSDLLDDALEPGDAAVVAAHLAECAECRRERERLRATVSLLRRVEPPRAPVGFVDGVMERAHPRPWYRRLGAWLFLPLSVKVPAEAAALVVVAGLAVYLWQRTPELREAARTEPPAPASSSSPPPQPSAPAEPSAPARTAAPTPAPVPHRTPVAPAPTPTPAAPSPAPSETREPPPASLPAPAPPAAAESESKRQDELARGRMSSVPRSSTAVTPAPFPASVVGRLTVTDRAEAARSLADLVSRVGGSEPRRRREGEATVVDIVIPEARYDEFVRSLEALGSWSAEGQPTALPGDPARIAITVRIQ